MNVRLRPWTNLLGWVSSMMSGSDILAEIEVGLEFKSSEYCVSCSSYEEEDLGDIAARLLSRFVPDARAIARGQLRS